MVIQSFRDLEVWQKGIDLVEETYRLTDRYPKREIYGLVSQSNRAAVSVPSNVAEGHQRDSTNQFLYHVSVALGSLAELETQLVCAVRLKFLKQQEFDEVLPLIDLLGRKLRNLQIALKRKLDS